MGIFDWLFGKGNLLVKAAKNGDVEELKDLIEKGADVNAKNTKGETALIAAAERGHLNIVDILFEKDADINAKNNKGWTALWMVASRGHSFIVRALLERGADVNAKENTGGNTALHMAALAGHTEIVKLLLKNNADVNANNTDDLTPLIMAADNGHPDVINVLLEANADVNAKDNEGVTALYSAAGKGHKGIVKTLIENGSDVNAVRTNGWTALMIAARDGHTEIVKTLLERDADVNAKNTDGLSALHSAIPDGHTEIVKLLMDNNADINAKSNGGITPLYWASLFGHTDIAKLLKEYGAEDVDKQTAKKKKQKTATNRSGSSAAMSAEWRQFFSIVPLHESAESVMMAFVGNWPKGLDPNVFSSLDISAFLSRIREYQTMPYPLRSPYFTPDNIPQPSYKMVDGNIARASSIIDMLLIEVVPTNIKKKIKQDEKVEPGQVVWKIIEHYSELPLAKLIFLLPFMYSASEAAKKGDKAVIMVIEDTLIQIYKGVENLLFDVYSDLSEGGLLSDTAVTKKLISLIAS